MPPKKDSGTERTKAQGQLTTKKTSARSIQSPHCALGITIGARDKRQAAPTTIGVYHTAKRRIRFSGFDLFAVASSIKFNNLVIEEFLDKVLTVKVMTLPQLIQPDGTDCPLVYKRGSDSPVKAEVSIAAVSSIKLPSMAMASPAKTFMVSPILTWRGLTTLSVPSSFITLT